MYKVSKICYFPILGAAGMELVSARLDGGGIMGDCERAVIGPDGTIITRSDCPALVKVYAHIGDNGLTISGCCGGDNILTNASMQKGEPFPIRLGDEKVLVVDCGNLVNTFLSEILGMPCRLVRFFRGHHKVAGQNLPPRLNLNPGRTFLICGTLSIVNLNEPPEAHIVITTEEPHEEKYWEYLRIGGVHMTPAQPHPMVGAHFSHTTMEAIRLGAEVNVGRTSISKLSTVASCP